MSFIARPHSLLHLLALTALLSGLMVWGAADHLAKETDQHFQAVAAEESLSITSCADDDTSPDPFPDSAPGSPLPLSPATGPHVADRGLPPSGARLLSGPGLPRAPPA